MDPGREEVPHGRDDLDAFGERLDLLGDLDEPVLQAIGQGDDDVAGPRALHQDVQVRDRAEHGKVSGQPGPDVAAFLGEIAHDPVAEAVVLEDLPDDPLGGPSRPDDEDVLSPDPGLAQGPLDQKAKNGKTTKLAPQARMITTREVCL